MIEVEIKFRMPDDQQLPKLIDEHHLEFGPAVVQQDIYYNHPQRNFRETQEALRIRVTGDGNALTYKGPRLDTLTRSRPEYEIAFHSGHAATEQLQTVFQALGFREIGVVKKTRRTATYVWEGRRVDVSYDEIGGLGRFIEIESISEPENWEADRDRLVRLEEYWSLLAYREPKSYLSMLLESRGVLSPGMTS